MLWLIHYVCGDACSQKHYGVVQFINYIYADTIHRHTINKSLIFLVNLLFFEEYVFTIAVWSSAIHKIYLCSSYPQTYNKYIADVFG